LTAYHWGADESTPHLESSSLPSAFPTIGAWPPIFPGSEGAVVVQIRSTTTEVNTDTTGPRCPGCQQRDDLIAELQRLLRQAQSALQKLRDRVSRNATNSSIPPSANPPDAPKLNSGKKSSGRKRGGQPGHPPANRQRLPPEQLADPPIDCLPTNCEHCNAQLSGVDNQAFPHQVTEIPPIMPETREYLRHTLDCPHCGHSTRGQLPAGVSESAFGPRLQALIGLCTGSYHLSKRQTEELLTTALNVPICLGSICRVEQHLSAALAAPVAEALEHLRASDVAYTDETSWKQQPDKAWLWVGATDDVAVFLVREKRDRASAFALLGKDFLGTVVSDRFATYNKFAYRQICWSHLDRDWQAFSDRPGPSHDIGEHLLELTDHMFALWHRVRAGTLDRGIFRFKMRGLRHDVVHWLRQGATCAHATTAGTCREILKVEANLWTFVNVEGVEPTNNAAERALRQAVLWRKKSFGTRGPAGSQYVERILTVVASCRLQGRNTLEYLTEVCQAAHKNKPVPSLLPKPRHRVSA
jgi:transposase